MMAVTSRNIKIYFRDKSAVFFSLMSVFIIIGLYALFLGNTLSNNYKDVKGVDFLINSWVMAGIICVTSVTTTLAAFGTMIKDRSDKVLKDFYCAPVKRCELAGGYILSSCIIGIIMSLLTFILAEIYIVSSGGELLPFVGILKMVGLIVLSVLTSGSIIVFLLSFLNSLNAYVNVSTIIGTLIGFIIGVYIPIGELPNYIQALIKLFPVSYSGILMRQVLLEQPCAISFENAPLKIIREFKLDMGVIFEFNGTEVSVEICLLILVMTTILFYGLSILSISRKNKK